MVACDYGPDGDPDVIAFAGSDTTQDVVGALVNSYNADATYNEDPDIPGVDKDSLDNILSVETNPNVVAGRRALRQPHLPHARDASRGAGSQRVGRRS